MCTFKQREGKTEGLSLKEQERQAFITSQKRKTKNSEGRHLAPYKQALSCKYGLQAGKHALSKKVRDFTMQRAGSRHQTFISVRTRKAGIADNHIF